MKKDRFGAGMVGFWMDLLSTTGMVVVGVQGMDLGAFAAIRQI